jgi:Tfp pilus assembly protein PilO
MAIKMTRLSSFLAVIIGLLLAFVLIFNPLFSLWKDLARRIEVVHLQYGRDTKTIDNYERYIELFNTYEAIARQARSDEEELAFFLKEIEEFSSGLALSIQDIKPMAPNDEKYTNRFGLQLEIQGPIADIISFFHRIASSETLIRIESFSLQTISRRDNVLNIKLAVSKTYLS